MRIQLGNGKFVDVRDVDDLRSGDRDSVEGAIKVEIDPETQTGFVVGNRHRVQMRALAAAVYQGGNLPFNLAKHPHRFGELTMGEEDALFEGLEAHARAVGILPPAEDDEPDPTTSDSPSSEPT